MSGIRSRARQRLLSVTGAGGGGPAPAGNVVWGPRFGKTSDDTFPVRVVAALLTKLTGTVAARAAVSLTSAKLDATIDPIVEVNVGDLALAGSADATAAATMDVDIAAAVTNAASAAVPAVALDATIDPTVAVAHDRIDLAGAAAGAVALAGTIAIVNLNPTDDTYLDRGNPNTVNGAATILNAQNNTAVVNNDENIYVAWDLTGLSGTATAITLRIFTETNQIGATTTAWQFYTHPTQPFDETVATWNNAEPPPGTQRQTGTYSAPVTPATVTITVDAAAALSNAIGNWCYLRIPGPSSGLDTTSVISVTSKEAASNKPEMDLTATL